MVYNIGDQENELFNEWRKHRPGLVPDGLVNQEAYHQSIPKLLFVLKEVNGYDEDLRDLLSNCERPQTWDVVTRWVLCLRNITKDYRWEEIEKVTQKQRDDALRTIIAVNLKKSSGGHTTDIKSLSAVAYEDKDFIKRQFLLYQPDLIICCGSIVKNLYYDIIRPPGKWKQTIRGIDFLEFAAGKFLISYAHPVARIDKSILHYGFVDAVKEICSLKIGNPLPFSQDPIPISS